MGNSSRKSISGLVPAPPDEPRPEDLPKGPTSRSSCPQFVPYSDDDDDGQDEDEEEEFFDASDSLPPPTQVLYVFNSNLMFCNASMILIFIFLLGRDGILIHSKTSKQSFRIREYCIVADKLSSLLPSCLKQCRFIKINILTVVKHDFCLSWKMHAVEIWSEYWITLNQIS